MALTQAQYTALKADIIADPAFNSVPDNSDGDFAIAAAYNLAANPQWVVWKTSVQRGEILENGFDWTRLDNLSVGKARVWSDIFVDGALNASKLNVRAGIEEVWKGTQADLDVRAVVYGHCKRDATRAETLFSTGTGSDAVPATMSHQGNLSYQDVGIARRNT